MGKKKGSSKGKKSTTSKKVPSYVKKAAKLKRNRGKTLKVTKQKKVPTTPRGIKLDRARPAKPPGWRVSKSGRVYFENRRNRSDESGARI